MISPRKNVNGHALNMLTLSTRLREFMKRRNLTRDEMASVIRTPRGTFDHGLTMMLTRLLVCLRS